MRFSSAMIIVPSQFKGVRKYHTMPSLGLGYIAQALHECGVTYSVVDMGLDYDINDIMAQIQEHKPQLVLLTAMSFGYQFAFDLINTIKVAHAEIKIFVGGPHVWSVREKALRECTNIDFAIPGEGEEIVQELCSGKPLEEIKGLYYWDNGELVFTGERGLFQNYATFPFPQYHNFELAKYAKYRKELTLQSSRGCPYQCTYCGSGAAFGKKLRAKSPEFFVNEIEYWYRRGYRRFHVGDDNFTLDIQRAFAICDEIERRKIKAKFFSGGGVRADRLPRELLFRMKEVGWDTIAIPVEGGNNRILANIKKGQSIEIVRETVKNACDAGLNVNLFFLIGSPGETWEDFMDSIKLAQEFPVADVKFYSIIPLPGTELYKWLETNNMFIREPADFMNNMLNIDEMPAFETPEMSREERIKARKLADEVRATVLKARQNTFRRFAGGMKEKLIKAIT